MNDTARLSLPFIMAGQALKHIAHNDALNRLDALVQPGDDFAHGVAEESLK
jgi:hypothetical protein